VCPDTGSQWCLKYNYGAASTPSFGSQSNLGSNLFQVIGTNAKNQIGSSAWVYDQRGNLLPAGYGGTTTGTYAYDAENRQTAACSPSDSTCVSTAGAGRTLYTYDGNGHRVMTSYATGETATFVYDVTGSVAVEYSTQPANLLCNTCYLTTDHLGGSRVMTNQAGTVVFRQDYLPFGESLLIGSTSPRYGIPGYGAATDLRQQFTSKERDNETGLDYFGARYFSGPQARFMSPDQPLNDQDPSDPQSWNLYMYGRNNPLRFVDPTGEFVASSGEGQNSPPAGPLQLFIDLSFTGADAARTFLGRNTLQAATYVTHAVSAAINDFRQNPNCTQTLVAGGQTIGAAWLGAYSAQVGAEVGGLAGAPSGPGALVTAGAGAAAFGSAGSTIGYYAGGGIAGVLSGAICSKAVDQGGSGNGGSPTRKWSFGGHKSAQTWANQMAKRGWTPQQIDEAIEHGQQFAAPNNVNPANGATRYVNPTTGRSVVVDNVTGELLQVGGNGFRY